MSFKRIEIDNRVEYRNHLDQLDRPDGPAVTWSDGAFAWYRMHRLHRLDGPAYQGADGTREWWQNNQRHRVDGPAIEYANGSKEYWIEGEKLTKEEFIARTQTKELTMAELEQLLGYPVKIKK